MFGLTILLKSSECITANSAVGLLTTIEANLNWLYKIPSSPNTFPFPKTATI